MTRPEGSVAKDRPVAVNIRPVPTEEEVAAIVAALAALTPSALPEARGPRRPGAWALAGRQRALTGIRGGAASGWGRPLRDGRR